MYRLHSNHFDFYKPINCSLFYGDEYSLKINEEKLPFLYVQIELECSLKF